MRRQAGKPPRNRELAGLRCRAAGYLGSGAGLLGEDFIRRARSDLDPPLGQADRLAHVIDELFLAVIAFPAPAVVKLDEVRTPTLGQGAPFLRDAIERIGIGP